MRSTTSCPDPLERVAPGLRTWRLPELERGGFGLRVWLLAWPTEPSETDRQSWLDLLDEPERIRLGRIGTTTGRSRFAASHAAARILIPHQQTWQVGRASLSHTTTMVAIATADVRVGIDVEADVPRPCWPAADRQQWPGFPSGSWPVFVDRWVRREASFKAGTLDGVGFPVVRRVRDLDGLPDHILAVVVAPGGGAQRGR